MSSRFRVLSLVVVAVALVVTAFVADRGRRSHAVVHAPSTLASASAAPVVSAAEPRPLPPSLNFVFDCAAFTPATAGTCGAEPAAAETTLLNVVNSYRVSSVPCSSWSDDIYAGAEAALSAAEKLDPTQLTPMDRALLQNAALELLSCRQGPAGTKKQSSLAATARSAIAKFLLTPEEISHLPDASAIVTPWLGDASTWKRGLDPRFFHTTSDGYARAHRQLQQNETFADLVRLVLVNKAHAPYVSDLVQRLVLRRTRPDGIHLCIAELDPGSARCPQPTLRPISQEHGDRILFGPPPCRGCHSGNQPRSGAFGPDTGFALADASGPRIQAALKALLFH